MNLESVNESMSTSHHASSESGSGSFHAGSDKWDIHMHEAEKFRCIQSHKIKALDHKFGQFKDNSPCFPNDERKISLPRSLTGIDRIEMGATINDILQSENKALFQARFYRNRCTDLEKKIRELEDEREGVRYFWRNQVLEGQSRAGKILKLATKC